MKIIIATDGITQIYVDDSLFDELNSRPWYFNTTTGYAYGWDADRKEPVPMHYWFLARIPNMEVDHIDRNKLNNQSNNLRHVTHAVNQLNRLPPTGERHNIYARHIGFEVNFKRNSKVIYLGWYPTFEAARSARDAWLSSNA